VIRTADGKTPFRLLGHQREVLEAMFAFDAEGRLPWQTLVYSAPKKSGKTAINAAVLTAWAYTQEAPNEIYIFANDQEQAKSRVYADVVQMIRQNPALLASVVGGERGLLREGFELTSGTTVRPMPASAAAVAGSRHGLTSWDELWLYTQVSSVRLWEEMTPVPVRRNSIRFVSTYAGYWSESDLLRTIYLAGVGTDEHEEGKGIRIHPEVPIWANREAGVVIYWDHTPRMPWQTPEYYAQQRADPGMRPGRYLQFHENRWAVAETVFITPELWTRVESSSVTPVVSDRGLPVWIGADAATKKDSAAVAAWTFDRERNRVRLVNHAVWYPEATTPVDLEATIERTIVEWNRRYLVEGVVYDPYQFAVIAKHLEEQGIPVVEFPQTVDRLTAMGSTLWELINGRTLEVYVDERLRAHAMATVARETPRGFRIVKDAAKKKIDLIIASGMAVHEMLRAEGGGPVQAWQFDLAAPVVEPADAVPPGADPMDPAAVALEEQRGRERAFFVA
jgi:phage terminase large subunit-like protein